jgi:hypothetical protein
MAIRRNAAKSKMNVSKYVRTAAMGKQIILVEGLDRYISELNRIGNNLNQATVIMRTRQVQNPNFEHIKSDFGNLVQVITNTLQGRNAIGNYQAGERKVG